MKKTIILLFVITTTILSNKLFANNPEGFENLLILENYTAGNDVFQQALENLGFTDYTSAYNGLSFPDGDNDFATYIDANNDGIYDGDWDLIIFNYDNATSQKVLNALNGYVLNGGYLIMTYQLVANFPSHPLWGNMGFAPVSGPPLTDPINFEATDASHDFFNTPNVINTTFNCPADLYTFYGHKFDITGTGIQIANIEADVTKGLIVVDNDERTVYNSIQLMSFTNDDDSDGKADNLELAENQISFITKLSASVSEINNLGINIYPNPSKGLLHININTKVNLLITDVTGKIIKRISLLGDTTINIENKGIYFLKFSDKNYTWTEKILVE